MIVCTRNRPDQLRRTLAALDEQTRGLRLTVVDQSDEIDPELERRAADRPDTTLIRDSGRGLSRARNIGWLNTPAEWLVYLDDDCMPEPAWLQAIEDEIAARPDADYVSCEVEEYEPPDAKYKAYSIFSVADHTRLTGRWTQPSALGYGACYAVKRTTVERLGGWDERLGAGAPDFPASDDMDFNFRLMRSGGVAYLTPHGRVLHDQWRPPEALPTLYRGYMTAACGYAMKHVRRGDVRGGLWLWSNAFRDMARAFASAAKHRSTLRLRIALAKLRGLVVGTAKGATRNWRGSEMGPHGGDPGR